MKPVIALAPLVGIIAACSAGGGAGEIGTGGAGHDSAVRVTNSAGSASSFQNPAWRDGTTLVATVFYSRYNQGGSDVHLITTAGADSEVTSDGRTQGVQNVSLPGRIFFPDGRFVYASDRAGLDAPWITSGVSFGTSVPNTPGRAIEPSVSPDGRSLVFEEEDPASPDLHQLWRIGVDGTALQRLSAEGVEGREPNWSPLGDRIVFQSSVNGLYDVFTMSTDGGNVVNVSNDAAAEDTDASFSPDGTHIVYSSDHGGLLTANLFMIATTGGTPVRITNSDAYDGAPSWSADGRIAFESNRNLTEQTDLFVIAAP